MIIQNISKSYKNKQILSDISFDAEPGSCIGILGCNGSGKSTLLNILAGVLKPDSGAFIFEKTNLFENHAFRSSTVGFVPQNPPLFEELNAWDNLSLWYDKNALKKELHNGVLKMLGIDEFLKTPVCKMSGGMKKRLAIGCAVCGNPKILLLDEPSSALDIICKQNIIDYLKDFKAQGGIIILATHDLNELEICDKLYILKDKKLSSYNYTGNPKELVQSL